MNPLEQLKNDMQSSETQYIEAMEASMKLFKEQKEAITQIAGTVGMRQIV